MQEMGNILRSKLVIRSPFDSFANLFLYVCTLGH